MLQQEQHTRQRNVDSVLKEEMTMFRKELNQLIQKNIFVSLTKAYQKMQDIEDDVEVQAMVTDKSNWELRLRSPNTIHEAASSNRHVRDIKCVICNQVSKKKEGKKYRLEKDNGTENFVKVSKK